MGPTRRPDGAVEEIGSIEQVVVNLSVSLVEIPENSPRGRKREVFSPARSESLVLQRGLGKSQVRDPFRK